MKIVVDIALLNFCQLFLDRLSLHLGLDVGGLQMRVEVVDLLNDDSSVFLLDELTRLDRRRRTRYYSLLWLQLDLLVELIFKCTKLGTI